MTTQDTTTQNAATDNRVRNRRRHVVAPDVRLLLVCHAEDMHDVYSDLSHTNSGLTARGWDQSDALGQWLRTHERIDLLACGPQFHNRLTAHRIGQALGLPVKVVKGLAACPVSDWQFLEGDAAPDSDEPEKDERQSYLEFHSAAVNSIDQLLADISGQTLALVTCPHTIATLVRHFFGAHQLSVHVEHTSVTELRRYGSHWQLCYTNRRQHMPVDRLPADLLASAPQITQPAEDLSPLVSIYNRVASADLERKMQDDSRRIRHLLEFASLPPDVSALDVGSGIGLLPMMLAENGAKGVVGIDISPAMLEHAEYIRLRTPASSATRVSFRLAPAQALPFSDEQFDAVLCRLVLHHSRRPEAIIREARRVLKPGGILVLADLLGDDDPVKRATQNAIEERRNPTHVAARTVQEYEQLVSDADFNIEATEEVSFKRELEEWLAAMQAEPADGVIVRDMIEAGLETDAAGINARHDNGALIFSQRTFYIKAIKPDSQ